MHVLTALRLDSWTVEFGRCTHRTSKIGNIGPAGTSASASRRCRCCQK